MCGMQILRVDVRTLILILVSDVLFLRVLVLRIYIWYVPCVKYKSNIKRISYQSDTEV